MPDEESLERKPAPIGRFAPSPTGYLHIGSITAALGSYLFAKFRGGRWLLRIEDIDKPRIIAGAEDDILKTLEELGFEWDGEIVRQSERQEHYREAFELLKNKGLIFPCGCSRKDISSAASAPHYNDKEHPYPGTCSKSLPEGKSPRSWRIRVPDNEIRFHDLLYGEVSFNLKETCGDFVVKRADNVYSYQLAVVVDDAFQGVTQVLRGSDLLVSTPRQILLQHYLGFCQPVYGHLPLVLSPEGGKLSKRDTLVAHSFQNLSRFGGSIITEAAGYLGQSIPSSLSSSDPKEIIAWLLSNFRDESVSSFPVRCKAVKISDGDNYAP